MNMRRAGAWAGWGVSMALFAAGLTLMFINALFPKSFSPFIFATPGFATIGALVATRTRNRIGWLLLATGFVAALVGFSFEYAARAFVSAPGSLAGGEWAAWVWHWTLVLHFPAFGLLLLLFPDGRLPSRRWRPIAIILVAAFGILAASNALADTVEIVGVEVRNPLATIFGESGTFLTYVAFFGAGALSLLACCFAPFVRRRRAGPDERIQLKWLAYVSVASAATALAMIPLQVLGGRGFTPMSVILVIVFIALVIVGIPVAVGIAILRHRLYDIDLVIRRTVVYVVLLGLITGLYFLMLYTVGSLVWFGTDPGLAIAATAFIAIAFQPVRRWVQRLASRLVYGKRASPYEAMADFSQRIAGALTLEEVLPRMAETAALGIGAIQSRVRVFLPDGGERSASWPEAGVDGHFERTVDVVHQAEKVGEIAVAKSRAEPITAAEEKLLTDLAAQAGPALRNVRLAEDLRASRRRIVAAQDEERRRLTGNLHDGAQQGLIALKVKLGLAERLAASDPEKARELLVNMQTEADETLENVRDLARGIYPPLLAERGLAEALASQAHKSSVPVEIRAEESNRYPQDIEAAVYFCCLEALQNVGKYANASRATIDLSEADDELSFAVADDGRGFDVSIVKKGSGLQNMSDRLEALGGTLEITSRPGEGTKITGRVPLQRE